MLRTIACVASLAGALLLAAPAAAAPKTAGSSSIQLAQPSLATASVASWPRYGDSVTFDISTNETAYPYVHLACYQGRDLVGQSWKGFFNGALGDRMFGLSSPIWTGGAADCTGSLVTFVNGRWKSLASTSFHVEA
jgi:hypothetical protein